MVERRSPKPNVVGSSPTWPGVDLLIQAYPAPNFRTSSFRGSIRMSRLIQFIKESYAELRKVVWPSKEDVISSVKVVIISTIIFAAVLGLVDVLLLFGVQAIF